jgi:uncharacterized protein YoxC
VQVGEIIFVIALNCIIIFILYSLQHKLLEKRIKYLKKEVQDLEDLVAAIIEEFEEIAEATESKVTEVQNALSEASPVVEIGPEIPMEMNDHFNIESEDSSKLIHPVENLPSDQNQINPPDKIEVRVEPNQNVEYFRPVTDPKHQQILDLREQGVSIEEIARHLSTGRGEVQLILGIYRRS